MGHAWPQFVRARLCWKRSVRLLAAESKGLGSQLDSEVTAPVTYHPLTIDSITSQSMTASDQSSNACGRHVRPKLTLGIYRHLPKSHVLVCLSVCLIVRLIWDTVSLTMRTLLVLDSQSSACNCLLNSGMKYLCHHAQHGPSEFSQISRDWNCVLTHVNI